MRHYSHHPPFWRTLAQIVRMRVRWWRDDLQQWWRQ
jgi:hypothetical protein